MGIKIIILFRKAIGFGIAAASICILVARLSNQLPVSWGGIPIGQLVIFSLFVCAIGLGMTLDSNAKLSRKERKKNTEEWNEMEASIDEFKYLDVLSENEVINKVRAEELFDLFASYPKINWNLSSKGCEARADMLGDVAHEHGVEVRKIWVWPKGFDRNSFAEGYPEPFNFFFDEAKTKMVSWNFHVAVTCKILISENQEQEYVFDPSLFNSPVRTEEWVERLESGGQRLKIHKSSRFEYLPLDAATPFNRENDVATRDETLRKDFDITNHSDHWRIS